MELETIDYPIDGTVEQLCTTCGGHESLFNGPLVKLELVEDDNGKQAVRATYRRTPFPEEFIQKPIFIFNITNMSSQKQNELAQQQMAQGHAEAFRGQVCLGGQPATVVVYREAIKQK
jgi:hypothetical protein